MQLCLALKKQYTVADYLNMVTEPSLSADAATID